MDEIVFCIIPSNKSYNDLNNLMKKYSLTLNSTDSLTLPPHLTIISRFKTNKYESLLKNLKKECSKFNNFYLIFNKIGFFKEQKIIYIEPKNKEELVNLHNILIELISDFRENWIRSSLLNTDMNERQKELIKKYGSPFVKEYYNPHITLAGPDVNENRFKEIISSNMEETNISFLVDSLSILKKVNDKWVIYDKINFNNFLKN
jgi:2'-5' RNA ligase